MSSNYYSNNYNTGYNNEYANGYANQASSNDYYNQHPQQYQPNYQNYTENVVPPTDSVPENGDRGLLGAIGGGIGGGILGKQTCHGFLGTVGGALIGSLTEDFIKKRSSRPSSPQPGAAGVAIASASASAVAGAGSHGGNTPLASPLSPPVYQSNCTPGGIAAVSSASTTSVATSYFQPPPCVGTAHPCPGNVHHCMPSQGHGHHGHTWGSWHK